MRAHTGLLLVAASVLTGCKAHDMGVPTSKNTADFVDASWVTATQSCWPELQHDGYSLAGIKHNLADPLRFRSTFPSYAAQDEKNLRALVTKPLLDAPSPDGTVLLNARTPVLTRGQAAAGQHPDPALVTSPNGTAPPDALCAVHAGTPVGFR